MKKYILIKNKSGDKGNRIKSELQRKIEERKDRMQKAEKKV